MRTLKLIDSQNRDWLVIHNPDWSGEVILRRVEPMDKNYARVVAEEYKIPGEVISAITARLAHDKAMELASDLITTLFGNAETR